MITKLANSLKLYRDNEDGTTAVEFGLIAIAFCTIVFAVIESGRFVLSWNAFQYAVESASRRALVDTALTEEQLETWVQNQMGQLYVPLENLNIDVTFSESNGINFVEIDGTYTYDVWVPFLPDSWDQIPIYAQSRLPRPPAPDAGA